MAAQARQLDSVSGRRGARLVSGHAGPVRHGGQRVGLRGRLPLQSRPGPFLRGSRETANTNWRSATRIYRGREDFVYRIAVGEQPFITQMFPLGGRSGLPVASIAGWNLPGNRVRLDTKAGPAHSADDRAARRMALQ